MRGRDEVMRQWSIHDPVYRSKTTTCRSLSSSVDALRIEPYGFEVVFSKHEDAVCRLPRIPLPRTPVNKLWTLLRASLLHGVDHLPSTGGSGLRLLLWRAQVFDPDLKGAVIPQLGTDPR